MPSQRSGRQFGGLLPQGPEREVSAQRSQAFAMRIRATRSLSRQWIESIRPRSRSLAKTHEAIAQKSGLPVKARFSRLDELANRAREARAETDVHGAIESPRERVNDFTRDGLTGLRLWGGVRFRLECVGTILKRKHGCTCLPHDGSAGADHVFALRGAVAAVPLDGDPKPRLRGRFSRREEPKRR